MKNIFLLIFLLHFIPGIAQHKIISDSRHGKYLDKTIIIKLKPAAKSKCTGDNITDTKLQAIFHDISTSTIKQKFPYSNRAKSNKTTVDISTIFELNYTNDISIDKVIARLKQNPDVEYAVPHKVVDPLYVPNDPSAPNQAHLAIIKAYDAWDICKGDTNVVIAITDWGTDTGHEDLMYNIAYNFNDPIDGIDNDDDGYIDNFSGWDMGAGDNNPQADANIYHGVYVTGLAAASTDNQKGVSGVGFKCRYIHIKVANAQGDGIAGYESIVYAADHGASVINCSWGDSIDYNSYAQDVINYATSKNCLVVAAAGNNNTQRPFYPASYEHVLSVAVLNNSDVKAGVSSYGIHTGISAPSQTYTTYQNNSYGNTGLYTSFATPIVTGCAAIVKSRYPSLNAEQIREVLKVTADNIDTIDANSAYVGLLGAGRVNLYRAVSVTLPPSIIFHTYTFADGNNDWLGPNDTVRLKGLFTNYLNPSSSGSTATISTTSAFAQILHGTNTIGAIGTMDTVNNFSNPFIFKLKPNTPFDTPVRLKITYSDNVTGYQAIQWIEFIARRSYADIYPNHIATTITANGNIGFNNFMQLNGIGFRYKGYDPLLYDAGLMFGNSQTNVSTCVRQSNSFVIQSPVTRILPPLVANEFYTSSFNDNANANALNISVEQQVFAWHADSASDFIIIEYGLINRGSASLQNMYAGIFADWDIGNSLANHVRYHGPLKFSYTYSNSSNDVFVGMKLLSSQSEKHYAIDQDPNTTDVINIAQGFSPAQKFHVLSNTRDAAGLSAIGIDVCNVTSAGPFNIGAGDTVKVTFALLAGENLYVLENAAMVAQQKYDSIHQTISAPLLDFDNNLIRIYPNLATNSFYIDLQNITGASKIIISDAIGNIIKDVKSNEKSTVIDCSKWSNGIYFVQVSNNNISQIKKIIISH